MKTAGIVMTLMLAGALALSGAQRVMAQPAAPAGKSTIAVVDMVLVFNSVDEKRKGDAEIEAMAKDLKQKRDALSAELETLKTDMASYTSDTAPGREAMDKAMKKALEFQNFSSYMQEKLSMEQRVRTAALYKKINDAVKTYADAHGVQLVLAFDKDNMADAANAQELQARITVRKVIYANDALDISKEIIAAMNTASHLGGNK